MRIVSVNAGGPRDVIWNDRVVTTAIFKEPVAGPVAVRKHQLDGDSQADPAGHDPSKAVYAYAVRHYDFWRAELPGVDLPWGKFGENLTVDDFDESEIWIGDEFVAGTARLVATHPRLPCFKLGIRFGRDDMIDRFLASRRTGVYFGIVEEGLIQAGDSMVCVRTNEAGITIAQATLLYTDTADDAELLQRAIALPALPDGWRRRFERKLDRLAAGERGQAPRQP